MNPATRVLVVEDEAAIAELIAVHLRHHGFEPVIAADGLAARRQVDSALPDVILLDWMLPGESGAQLTRRWRQDARTRLVPILMLTARGDEADKVAGLEAGADDYIVKPFSPAELLARIRAVLRRRAPEQAGEPLVVGALHLEPATHRVSRAGEPLKLGPTEFRLLRYLMSRAERVHSRAQLLDSVWGDHVYIEERTVDVHIKRLREALGDAGAMVQTVRGSGYRLTAQPPAPGAEPGATP